MESKKKKILIILILILLIIYGVCLWRMTRNNVFNIQNVNDNVYEFKDGSWFICNDNENTYVFQAVELGDWDYELDNKEDLKKIIATYFINKYNISEDKAIKKVNDIVEEVK